MPYIRVWKIIGDKAQCPYCNQLYDNDDASRFDHECEECSKIMDAESELETLVVHGVKELGEIAECLVKNQDMFDHWKNELGDLCICSIKPMLELAGISFEDACKIGLERYRKKKNKDQK